MTRTIVHLVRHGEVHNPEKILYGRIPAITCPRAGIPWRRAPRSPSATTM